MSALSVPPIRFVLKDHVFSVCESADTTVVENEQKPDEEVLVTSPNTNFIRCTYKHLIVKGSALFDNCVIERVHAFGNLIFLNCSVRWIDTTGDLALIRSRNYEEIKGKEIFLKGEALKSTVTVHGKCTLLFDPSEVGHVIIDSGSIIAESVFLCADNKILTIDNAICYKDIIFPEDSAFHEEERQVILINGGQLLGKVIGGHLVNKNTP